MNEIFTFKNQDIHYRYHQKSDTTLVFLHGWGQSMIMMEPIEMSFQPHFSTLNLDFPGFGLSAPLNDVWSITDYADGIEALLNHLNVQNPVFVAHSFGARVALILASRLQPKQMILTGAAGLKPRLSLGTHLKIRTYKLLKIGLRLPFVGKHLLPLKTFFGSEDYKQTTGALRQTFVKVVNEDLSPLLKQITTSTLLIWGDKDDATPLWMGKTMEKHMKDAALIIYEDDDHYAYYHQLKRTIKIIEAFVQQK
ncbi:MAG: alpha/beta hydrolase [Erysipelotrichaceae bacterium]|nr:alpha/beta hydrolase [Erysipelotrichaceae bacterium]